MRFWDQCRVVEVAFVAFFLLFLFVVLALFSCFSACPVFEAINTPSSSTPYLLNRSRCVKHCISSSGFFRLRGGIYVAFTKDVLLLTFVTKLQFSRMVFVFFLSQRGCCNCNYAFANAISRTSTTWCWHFHAATDCFSCLCSSGLTIFSTHSSTLWVSRYVSTSDHFHVVTISSGVMT